MKLSIKAVVKRKADDIQFWLDKVEEYLSMLSPEELGGGDGIGEALYAAFGDIGVPEEFQERILKNYGWFHKR